MRFFSVLKGTTQFLVATSVAGATVGATAGAACGGVTGVVEGAMSAHGLQINDMQIQGSSVSRLNKCKTLVSEICFYTSKNAWEGAVTGFQIGAGPMFWALRAAFRSASCSPAEQGFSSLSDSSPKV